MTFSTQKIEFRNFEFCKDLIESCHKFGKDDIDFEIISDYEYVKIFKLKNLPEIYSTNQSGGIYTGQIIRNYENTNITYSFILNEKYNGWSLNCIDVNYTTETFALWKYVE